jgi:hypothetical protein
MNYHYAAFGLAIRSEFRLPELIPMSMIAAPDVTIRRGTVTADLEVRPDYEDVQSFVLAENSVCFYWTILGAFRINEGKEVVVDPNPGVDERLVRLPLLGTVMAALLQQRNLLTLHGSVVSLRGRGVAFLGGKGFGKSTMAATLYKLGHCLMSDDIVAIRFSDPEGPTVLSGYPQFKLWPDAVASLGDDPAALNQICANYEKLESRAIEQFFQGAVPLERIYLLSVGPKAEIEPLDPQFAFLQLICNTYTSRYGNQLLEGSVGAEHLKRWGRIVNQVPIRRLRRPVSLDMLPQVARMVEEEVWGAKLGV